MAGKKKGLILFFTIVTIVTSVNSENLNSVLKDAYNYYPDIKKSKIDLQNKNRDLSISKTDFLPSIDLSVTQGKSITKSFPDTSNYGDNALNPSTIDVDISQPLGASKYLNYKQAKNNLFAGEFGDKSIIQNILYRASKAYYTLLKDSFLLDVSIKNENNLRLKLDATEKRFNFRDVTKTDVFQAKARFADATSKRIEAENNLEISISEFKAIVGRDPDLNWYSNKDKLITESNPIDWNKFGELPKTPSSLESAVNMALDNNPELNKLKYELDNSKISIKKKTLNFFPELSISGSYGKSIESARTIDRKDSYEITANMSVPLFNKGHNFYNLEKSKDSAISIAKSLESKKINLKHEVQSSWKKIQSLKSSIDALKLSVESNEVALDGVSKEAGVGSRTTLNILDAEKELTQAEASLVNARYQLINSSFELLRSCGLLNFSYLEIN